MPAPFGSNLYCLEGMWIDVRVDEVLAREVELEAAVLPARSGSLRSAFGEVSLGSVQVDP